MKTISLAVSEKHYELFRQRAKAENRSIASLIRDAMADYLVEQGPRRGAGRAADGALEGLIPGPGRYRIYAEVDEV